MDQDRALYTQTLADRQNQKQKTPQTIIKLFPPSTAHHATSNPSNHGRKSGVHVRRMSVSSPPTTAEDGGFPQSFLPAEISEIEDKDCIAMAKRLVRKEVTVPRDVSASPIATSFAGSKPEVIFSTPQTDRQTDTQTDRQTDRHRHKTQTQTQTKTEAET